MLNVAAELGILLRLSFLRDGGCKLPVTLFYYVLRWGLRAAHTLSVPRLFALWLLQVYLHVSTVDYPYRSEAYDDSQHGLLR